AGRLSATLLLSLHPLSRRRHDARDHRSAFSRHQASAGSGGAATVLRDPRCAGHEEETFDLGIARLAEVAHGRGYFRRDVARARPEKAHPAVAWRTHQER